MKAKVIVKIAHDAGTANISVWADSIEQAIELVANNEKAPKRAIISAKVDRLTIYDIKRLSEEKSPYFFTRKTLSFFKQKMTDFSVTRWGNDKFKISAPMPYGRTERIFNPFTGELERIPETV